MDDNKTNQSIDGMMGGEPNQPVTSASPSMDGFRPTTANNSARTEQTNPDYSAEPNTPEQDVYDQHQAPGNQVTSGNGGSGKKLKVLLTLFIILFIAATAAAVYFYTESQKTPTTVISADVTKLQQQNDSLVYDNKSLTTTNKLLVTKNTSLLTVAQQLKTKCGSGCTAIVIPQ